MTDKLSPKARQTGLIIVSIAIALWVGYALKSARKPESIPLAPASIESIGFRHVGASMDLPFADFRAAFCSDPADTGGAR